MRTHDDSGRQTGQVLPVTALFMTALLLFGALAIDVTRVLSSERFNTAVADAAALAGAQDLQVDKTRQVNAARQIAARTNAMRVIVDQLGASAPPSGAGCEPTSDVVNCQLDPALPYEVSIKTPSPSCVLCDPERSVQVTVRDPAFDLTFANLVGQGSWDVSSTAVAGLRFPGQYAILTLRPPQPLPNGDDQNQKNLNLAGTNSRVTVLRGDIGTNTSAFTNSASYIQLASGYRIEHYDDINPDPWNKINGSPGGELLQSLIPDPAYRIADFSTATVFTDQNDGALPSCPAPGDVDNPFPPDYDGFLRTGGYTVICYQPGDYDTGSNKPFTVDNGEVAYLMPGAYRFQGGMRVRGSLLGGLVGNAEGVVLVVPQSVTLDAANALAIILNKGDETCQADSCRSMPAEDSVGSVATPEGLALTIEVPRDESCFTGTTPVLCADNGNYTLKIPGNAQIDISGVIYAPSDHVEVNGDNTGTTGRVGQMIGWTIDYAGNSSLEQDYPELEEIAVLRLDPACTGQEVCNNP